MALKYSEAYHKASVFLSMSMLFVSHMAISHIHLYTTTFDLCNYNKYCLNLLAAKEEKIRLSQEKNSDRIKPYYILYNFYSV